MVLAKVDFSIMQNIPILPANTAVVQVLQYGGGTATTELHDTRQRKSLWHAERPHKRSRVTENRQTDCKRTKTPRRAGKRSTKGNGIMALRPEHTGLKEKAHPPCWRTKTQTKPSQCTGVSHAYNNSSNTRPMPKAQMGHNPHSTGLSTAKKTQREWKTLERSSPQGQQPPEGTIPVHKWRELRP